MKDFTCDIRYDYREPVNVRIMAGKIVVLGRGHFEGDRIHNVPTALRHKYISILRASGLLFVLNIPKGDRTRFWI